MIAREIVIGTVARPRGISGELKITPITDDPHRFLSLKTVFVDGREYRVRSASVNPSGVFVALECFHFSVLPLQLLITIINATKGVPFPPLAERTN